MRTGPFPTVRLRASGYGRGVAIGPMVSLTTVANPVAARILAAHLGAEGIVWELRGNVDGPYPLGPVEVLVAADDLAVGPPAACVEQEIAAEEAASRTRTGFGTGTRRRGVPGRCGCPWCCS